MRDLQFLTCVLGYYDEHEKDGLQRTMVHFAPGKDKNTHSAWNPTAISILYLLRASLAFLGKD